LLLAEPPESPRSVLGSLRQASGDETVAVARIGGHALYPARFQLVGTISLSFRRAAVRPDPGGSHRLNPCE